MRQITAENVLPGMTLFLTSPDAVMMVMSNEVRFDARRTIRGIYPSGATVVLEDVNPTRYFDTFPVVTPAHPLERYPKLTTLEHKLLVALKQAYKFIVYVECFRGKATARVDMQRQLALWKEHRPTSTGIGVGATYLNDAEFNFEVAEKLIAEGEKLNGAPVALPEIWA